MTNALLIGIMALLVINLIIMVLTDMYFNTVKKENELVMEANKAVMEYLDALDARCNALSDCYDTLLSIAEKEINDKRSKGSR